MLSLKQKVFPFVKMSSYSTLLCYSLKFWPLAYISIFPFPGTNTEGTVVSQELISPGTKW